MTLFNEPVNRKIRGLHVRQYSHACFEVTTNPRGHDEYDIAEYLSANIVFMGKSNFRLDFNGTSTIEEHEKIFNTVKEIVNQR